MSQAYRRLTTFYQSISGNLSVAAATGNTTLVTAPANHTLYLQKLHIEITAGSGGVTWSFTDSAGTPINLVPSLDASAIAHYDFDFGPEGIPLTEEKNLLFAVSAAGAAGWVTWEGYKKLTKAGAHA